MAQITVYGSTWCGFTQRAIRHMNELGVEYTFVDVDKNPDAEALIASWNNGRSIRPTFDINGQHLVNPSAQQIRDAMTNVE
jgi:mycoredoxin